MSIQLEDITAFCVTCGEETLMKPNGKIEDTQFYKCRACGSVYSEFAVTDRRHQDYLRFVARGRRSTVVAAR